MTILSNTFGVDTQTQCKSYTWIDGNTYTTNNNSAIFILTNSMGCDSIVTLDLTIINEPTFEIITDQNWCETDSAKQVTINNSGVPPFQFSIMKNQEIIENCSTMNFSENVSINDFGIYYIIDYQDNICDTDTIGKFNLIFRPSPFADFTTFPQETDLNNPNIFFRNLSTPNSFASWDFGDGFSAENLNFDTHYSYNDTGVYLVTLNLENQYGCINSTTKEVTIYPAFDIFIPSAFSPNNDNLNDIFKPTLYGVVDFNMIITNRWGELIYQTDDKYKGWNGSLANNTEKYMTANYTYRIDVTDYFGKKHFYIGNVLLVH